jgi:hypothetical protein
MNDLDISINSVCKYYFDVTYVVRLNKYLSHGDGLYMGDN